VGAKLPTAHRMSWHLAEAHEALYWKSAKVNPYGPNRDLTVAIEKLLECGREGAAVMCVACTADDKSRFDESLAMLLSLPQKKPK